MPPITPPENLPEDEFGGNDGELLPMLASFSELLEKELAEVLEVAVALLLPETRGAEFKSLLLLAAVAPAGVIFQNPNC